MELILWRHAEAEDTHPDMNRVLTARGRQQAEKTAAWLKPRIPANIRILVSPAERTQQTASALGLDFSTMNTLAPGASAQTIIEAVGWPNAKGAVLVVGHQPTLGMVASYAMTGAALGWSVRKGGVWWVSGRLRFGEEQAVLRAVLSPDLI